MRVFRLPLEIEIAVPRDWSLAREEDLAAYEITRDRALAQWGVGPAVPSMVPFQATSGTAHGSTAVMLSVLPPEASQEEVSSWTAPEIVELGRRLGVAQRDGLVAAGASGVVVERAARVDLGEKLAIRLLLDFVGADTRRFKAEKHFIYTASRTVVLTFQWTEGAAGTKWQRDRDRIRASFRVR